MTHGGGKPPPLSPVLLLGFALRPAPMPVLQAAASAAMAAMRRRHDSVFERLSGLANPLFLIDPTDLPFRLLLDVTRAAPRLTVLRADTAPATPPGATISGPMPVLIELLEGRIDGDALFFNRALAVSGDMEAVVALRNAVDGAEIDLVEDLIRPLGPLAAPARRLAGLGSALYRRAEADLESLRAALLAPVLRRADAQEAHLRELEETMASLPPRKRERRA